MAAITEQFGTGGANMAPSDATGLPNVSDALRDIADDLAELHTQFIALLVKLDADAGTAFGDYASSLTPVDMKTTKV